MSFWYERGVLLNVIRSDSTKDIFRYSGALSIKLCEKGVYQAIFLELLRLGYEIRKIDLSHCATDTKDIEAKKGDRPAMMAIRR